MASRPSASAALGTVRSPVVAACATAAMAAAAIRPWGLGVLALIAYVPAFLAVSRARNAVRAAALAGLAALGVDSVAYEAARVLFPGAYAVTLALSVLPFVLVGACVVRLRRLVETRSNHRAAQVVALTALPILWSAAEWLPAQPWLLGQWALPLGFIGYSQVGLPTADVARFGSVAAVSLLVLAVNAGFASAWVMVTDRNRSPLPTRRPQRRSRLVPVGAFAVLVGLVSAGGPPVSLDVERVGGPADASLTGSQFLSVRIVQPNLADSAYFSAKASDGVRDSLRLRLETAVSTASNAPVDLVVLPEAAWPGTIDRADVQVEAAAVAEAFGTNTVLFGAPARSDDLTRGITNSVFLHSLAGLEHAYAKRRTVPIAERGLRAGSRTSTVRIAGIHVASIVCYDALFPADVRAAAAAGAQVIVAVTNDSFAAVSDIPELHLRAARMRALEVGLPVVLASNTGPSALIAADGDVVTRLEGGAPEVLEGHVMVGGPTTPYARHGDWLSGANAAVAGGLALTASRGGRSHKRST